MDTYIPWFAWIAIAGVAAWALLATVSLIVDRRKPADDEIAAVRTQLDSIDRRLSNVEKAINDIP